MVTKTNHLKFEDCIKIIDEELLKRRHKWTLTSIASIDYDDISQIIRLHIYIKWGQFDQSRPLRPWVSTIITRQLKNLIRNNYTNYARPCLRCDAAIDSDGCKIYGKQCEECPLFAHWKKHKEPATFVKLPVSMENHTNEVFNLPDSQTYMSEDVEKLHAVMKKILKPIEYRVYKGLYINHQEEINVAKQIGFVDNATGKKTGLRQLVSIKKEIIKKAKKYVSEKGLN